MKKTFVGQGDQFVMLSGKATTPCPKIDYKSHKRSSKALFSWYKENALNEAKYRFDQSHIPTMIKGLNPDNWSVADTSMVLLYLFNRCDGNIEEFRVSSSCAA